MFVDRAAIFVQGGDGGRGCSSFRRERFVPRGGPDGGDGGRGGHVIVTAVQGIDTLLDIVHRKHWRAPCGGPGGGSNRHGANGQDLVIGVPGGTVVRDRNRGHMLRDLASVGDQVVVARGGKGGHGNKAFASATRQAPRAAEPGVPGERRWLELELKLIAHVGLIGLPNAGKSTLLSRISHAHPEIAGYPFTTKVPNLGLVRDPGGGGFVVADIPGLIEGAHDGAGLGHQFLRHVERTRVLAHLVESHDPGGTSPGDRYHTVRRELALYSEHLIDKPEVVVMTKMDLTDSDARRDELSASLGLPVLGISAVTGRGLRVFVGRLAEELARLNVELRE